MCVIIDANTATRVFSGANDPDFHEIYTCIVGTGKPTVRVVYGGKLLKEYMKLKWVMRIILQLDRAGRAKKISDTAVDEEEKIVRSLKLCKSDDEHVIAIARIGNVRVLCTHDQLLHVDFSNKDLIDKPRGSVYQNSTHRHILLKHCTKKKNK